MLSSPSAVSSQKTLRDVPLRSVPVVEPSTSLQEAIERMEADPLQAVVLVGDEQYMGLFTPDALESELIPRGVDRSLLPIGPYVHPTKVIGAPHHSLSAVLETMQRRGLDLIPVVEGAIFKGVITRADIEATL